MFSFSHFSSIFFRDNIRSIGHNRFPRLPRVLFPQNILMNKKGGVLEVKVESPTTPVSPQAAQDPKAIEKDKAVTNYRLTKDSAWGMVLVAFASIFGR